MNELALFAGAGGGLLGSILNGWRTVCAVEIDDYCRRVLLQRQRDGVLDKFPIWDDVRTFDGRPWRGCVDIVTGGFPCQDISCAGSGDGLDGERSGLWHDMYRIIGEVRPRYVLVENSAMLVVRGLGTILGQLSAIGFDARWEVVSACVIGAPHTRERLFIVADANQVDGSPRLGRIQRKESHEWTRSLWGSSDGERAEGYFAARLETPSGPARVVDGMADRLDRNRAIGNGQVPAVVKAAWELLQ